MENKFYAVAGDLHFERAQYGLNLRYEDNQRCIETIVQTVCNDKDCLGLILTGDNFNKKSLLPKYQIRFAKIYKRVIAAGKKLIAIDGNHDGSDASWLDTISDDLNSDGKVLELGRKKCACLAFRPRAKLYEKIKELPPINILVIHGRLLEMMGWASSQKEPSYDFSARELRELGLKNCTVLMGDIHTYGDYHDPIGNNWFIYTGSTEMSEISEGNILSLRFGNHYDTVKKFLRFYPDRAFNENWDLVDLPNRPFLRRIVEPTEDVNLVIKELDTWISANPKGILSLHYPQAMRTDLKEKLAEWKNALLGLFDVPVSTSVSKPLQDMKESDILIIAQQEMSSRQVRLLQKLLEIQEPTPLNVEKILRPELQINET